MSFQELWREAKMISRLFSSHRDPQLFFQMHGSIYMRKARAILPVFQDEQDFLQQHMLDSFYVCKNHQPCNHRSADYFSLRLRLIGGGCGASHHGSQNRILPVAEVTETARKDNDQKSEPALSTVVIPSNQTENIIDHPQHPNLDSLQLRIEQDVRFSDLSNRSDIAIQCDILVSEMNGLNEVAERKHDTKGFSSENCVPSPGSMTTSISAAVMDTNTIPHTCSKESIVKSRITDESLKTMQGEISPHENVGNNRQLLVWLNYFLSKVDLRAENLSSDLDDGFFTIIMIEIITNFKIVPSNSRLSSDQPIVEQELIEENTSSLKLWWQVHQLDSIVSPCGHIHVDILWTLAVLSLGLPFDKESPMSCFLLCKKYLDSVDIPFLFDKDTSHSSKTILVLHCSILKDKLNGSKDMATSKVMQKWVPPPQRIETGKPISKLVSDHGVLRIFLSSTFRDMQNERDMFFQHGAPELKRLASSKGLDLIFIDLRWGLTAQDSSDGWVVVRCCDSISKCPYFVCFLGSRYGWVPDPEKNERNRNERLLELQKSRPDATEKDIWVEWHSETNSRYPFLDALPGLSVTEYEVQYAALIDRPACSRAFFYFRDEQFAIENATSEQESTLYRAESPEMAARQQELKAKIKSRYGAVTYRGAKHFSDLVTSHVGYSLEKDFSEITKHDPEDKAHDQFMTHRLTGFEGREDFIKNVIRNVDLQLNSEDSQTTVVAAESGIGKSSLMAAVVRELNSSSQSHLFVLYHFVGCTNFSNYFDSISIRFWKSAFRLHIDSSFRQESFQDSDLKKEGLHGLVQRLGQRARNAKFIIVIDAINQLQPSQDIPAPQLLTWLPKKTPKNISILVSTIDTHESYTTIQTLGLPIINVSKLSRDEINLGAESYLSRYDKKLSGEQLQFLTHDEKRTGHPLYLRLILDEIRVFGVYEKLSHEIQTLLSCESVIELYDLIITRWKTKYDSPGQSVVEGAIKVLYISRIGLSEEELDKYISSTVGLSFDLARWKSFFFTLSESLFVRNGRYMFFHQLFFQSVKSKFFQIDSGLTELHRHYGMWLLGMYADSAHVDHQVIAEICYQLLMGSCYESLVEFLKNEHVVLAMLNGRYRYEFFHCWRVIQSKGAGDYKDAYTRLVKSTSAAGDALADFFIEAFENTFLIVTIPQRLLKRNKEESKADDYLRLGRVYKNMKYWALSLENLNKCLEIKLHYGIEDESLALLYDEIGEIHLHQDSVDDSVSSYQKGFDVRERLFGGVDLRLALSLDHFGNAFLSQQRYDEASSSFAAALEMRLQIVGNGHPLVATSCFNVSKVQFSQKRYSESISNLAKAKQIWESTLGARHPSVALSMYHTALALEAQAQYQESLSLLRPAAIIFSEFLGENHPNYVMTIEKIADIEYQLKSFSKSLEEYTNVLQIQKRTIGESHPAFANVLEKVALSNFMMKRYDQVIECLEISANVRQITKTIMTFPLMDCIQMLQMVEKTQQHLVMIHLNKRIAYLYFELQNYESWDAWRVYEITDKIFIKANMHRQAIEFWTEARDCFAKNLNWVHIRTLLCCEFIAFHWKNLGKIHHPIEFTAIHSFLGRETGRSSTESAFDAIECIPALLDVVMSSRSHPENAVIASQAMTLLNFINYPFSGLDFSGISIPDANMSFSVVDGANFSGANLTRVDFRNAYLGKANFQKAVLNGVRLGLSKFALKGHNNYINAVCHLQGPNGEPWLASAGNDATIRLWEVATGRELRQLSSHKGWILSLCKVESMDRTISLASAGRDHTILVWDVVTGALLKSLHGHKLDVSSLCFIKGPTNKNWLVSGSYDKTIGIWDVDSGSQEMVLSGHTGYVESVCEIRRGSEEILLASGGGNAIRIWDLVKGIQIMTLNGHTSSVYSLCAAQGPDMTPWLVSGSEDRSVRVWNTRTGEQMKVLTGHTNCVKSVCSISGPNGECWLASGSHGKTIRVWDLVTGTQVRAFTGNTSRVGSICSFGIDQGELYLACGVDDVVRVWSLGFGNSIKQINIPVTPAFSTCILSKTDRFYWFASGHEDASIHIWDMKTCRHLRELKGHSERIRSLCQADGPKQELWLVSSGSDDSIRVWDPIEGEQICCIQLPNGPANAVCSIPSTTGKCLIASGGAGRTVFIWDIQSGLALKELHGHTDSIQSLAFIKDESGMEYLVSGGDDRVACVWNLETWCLVHTLQGHNGDVYSVCGIKGRDGRSLIASGSWDRTAKLWDLESGAIVRTHEGHENYVKCISHIDGNDNNTWLLTASWDNTFRLWNLESSLQIKSMRSHSNWIYSLCKSVDREGTQFFVSSSLDQTIRVWKVVFPSSLSGFGSLSAGGSDKKNDSASLSNDEAESVKLTKEFETNVIYTPDLLVLFRIGNVRLEGGALDLRQSEGLSMHNKLLLFANGGAAFDQDFISYCETSIKTEYQEEMLARCFAEGYAVSSDAGQVMDWLGAFD